MINVPVIKLDAVLAKFMGVRSGEVLEVVEEEEEEEEEEEDEDVEEEEREEEGRGEGMVDERDGGRDGVERGEEWT